VNFSDTPTTPTARTYTPSAGGLDWTGAYSVTAAALPAGLRTGVTSPPNALVNAPSLPGLGDASIAVTLAGDANVTSNVTGRATFRPVSMVLTQDLDPRLAATLGQPRNISEAGRVIVSCYLGSTQLAAGVVKLKAGLPGKVTFPSACGSASRVVIAPGASSVQLVLDDFVYVPGNATATLKSNGTA